MCGCKQCGAGGTNQNARTNMASSTWTPAREVSCNIPCNHGCQYCPCGGKGVAPHGGDAPGCNCVLCVRASRPCPAPVCTLPFRPLLCRLVHLGFGLPWVLLIACAVYWNDYRLRQREVRTRMLQGRGTNSARPCPIPGPAHVHGATHEQGRLPESP